MERFSRLGRRFPLPSTVEIIHELRMRMEAERVNALYAELVTLRGGPRRLLKKSLASGSETIHSG